MTWTREAFVDLAVKDYAYTAEEAGGMWDSKQPPDVPIEALRVGLISCLIARDIGREKAGTMQQFVLRTITLLDCIEATLGEVRA